jgi:hypothetical protein
MRTGPDHPGQPLTLIGAQHHRRQRRLRHDTSSRQREEDRRNRSTASQPNVSGDTLLVSWKRGSLPAFRRPGGCIARRRRGPIPLLYRARRQRGEAPPGRRRRVGRPRFRDTRSTSPMRTAYRRAMSAAPGPDGCAAVGTFGHPGPGGAGRPFASAGLEMR